MKLIDLTGQKFGKFSVLYRDVKRNGTYWICRCECGNITSVNSSNLRLGKSTGCKNCANRGHNIDLKNCKFGKLTTISFFNGKWKCECECGNTIYVKTNDLLSGNTTSCGCKHKTPHIVPHTCKNCGVEFKGGPRATYCPSCRDDRKKSQAKQARERAKAGTTRKIGQEYPCEICGTPYILNSGLQRYCKKCAAEHLRESEKKLSKARTEKNKDSVNAERRTKRKSERINNLDNIANQVTQKRKL